MKYFWAETTYRCFQDRTQSESSSLGLEDERDRLKPYWAQAEGGVPSSKNIPTCETDKPASSINWSSEKAPTLIRSLSRAAAFFADSVWSWLSMDIVTRRMKNDVLPSKPFLYPTRFPENVIWKSLRDCTKRESRMWNGAFCDAGNKYQALGNSLMSVHFAEPGIVNAGAP